MKKHVYLIPVLLLVTSVGYYFLANDDNNPSSDLAAPELSPNASLPVKVAYAHRGTLVLRVLATGYTRAIRQVPFTAQVGGVVDSLPVFEGKKVRKNELLLKINDTDYRLAVAEAQEQLNQAIITYGQQRAERLNATIRVDTSLGYYLDPRRAEAAYHQAEMDHAAGKISEEALFLQKSEYEAAKLFAEDDKQRLIASRSGLNKAMIGLQRVELNLSRTRLTAPFAGIVANLKINLGQPVTAGTESLTLVKLDTILIDVEILESEAPQVEMGRYAAATIAAFPKEIFKGKVVALNPVVDVEKRVRRAVVAIPNTDHHLIPGLYAQVKIESQLLTDRLIVPKEAIVIRDQRKVVFVVRSEGAAGEGGVESGGVGERESGGEGERGKMGLLAKWCYVETGAENEEEVEVVSSAFNLQPGEPVVVTNHFTMAHDTPVRIE